MEDPKLQASVNIVRRPTILPDMLVQDIQGNIGIVTLITNNYVHVTVLIRAPDVPFTENYHGIIRHKRASLTPLPANTRLQIKQKAQ